MGPIAGASNGPGRLVLYRHPSTRWQQSTTKSHSRKKKKKKGLWYLNAVVTHESTKTPFDSFHVCQRK